MIKPNAKNGFSESLFSCFFFSRLLETIRAIEVFTSSLKSQSFLSEAYLWSSNKNETGHLCFFFGFILLLLGKCL